MNFARQEGLTVAVRGGGHNGAGLGVCDHGLVIDLSSMKGVRVDPATNTVRAEAGCTQADLNHAAHSFGLAVPVGVVSTTGIAGLTLGGGTGYLTRKYGLALDNLLEADLVLADGRFVTASAKENPDLFLGDPRWRRQLWHCYVVSISRVSGGSGLCRSDALGNGTRARTDAVVP